MANRPTLLLHPCNKFLLNSYRGLALRRETGAAAGLGEWWVLRCHAEYQAAINHTLLWLCLSGHYSISTNISSLKKLLIYIYLTDKETESRRISKTESWQNIQVFQSDLYPMAILFCFASLHNATSVSWLFSLQAILVFYHFYFPIVGLVYIYELTLFFTKSSDLQLCSECPPWYTIEI